jgi:hypothetical protein|nr:MAG TPA: RNA polymerase Rpb5-like protein [Caudoviricetes sp.]
MPPRTGRRVRTPVRDFYKLPLLTPEEAFERAWDDHRERPLFDLGYRVRNPAAWKTIESLLRQYDVRTIAIASFGLKSPDDALDVLSMLSDRGWLVGQTSANVYVGGERRTIQAFKAEHLGD